MKREQKVSMAATSKASCLLQKELGIAGGEKITIADLMKTKKSRDKLSHK